MSKANQPAKVMEIKKILNAPSVEEQFENALGENSGAFVASVIDLYNNDDYLQKCDPQKVVMEALKAATLKLPINKQLGFAYILPFNRQPEFTIGYKGYIQLAMRSGKYKHLNADVVYEGEEVEKDRLTGNIDITGEPESDEVKGYFAYEELVNGFSKTIYMTKEDVIKHAKKHSPSYGNNSSAWATDFNKMGKKTTLRQLLGKYGYLSTEMISAFNKERGYSPEQEVEAEIEENANSETIDIEPEPGDQDEKKSGQPEQESPGQQKKSGGQEKPEFG
ncbi:MAG: recombinase RecT [Bacteroidota bacterium]